MHSKSNDSIGMGLNALNDALEKHKSTIIGNQERMVFGKMILKTIPLIS